MTPAPSIDESQVGLAWLARMRWGAALAICVAIAVTSMPLGVELELLPMLALVGLMVATNGWLVLRLRGGDARDDGRVAGSLLVLDTATLTALLYLSGGPSNPFSALYFVYVTLAAVLLGARWTAALWVAGVVGYGLLFVDHVPIPALAHHGGGASMDHAMHAAHGAMPAEADGGGFQAHLYGMFVAFAVSAGLMAAIVTRLSAALRRGERQLERARRRAAQSQRLASLTTLAAGAAHELGTPLGTIAVVARELERALEDVGGSLSEDARLIRSEVDRCRSILDRMASQAGGAAGEAPLSVALADICADASAGLPAELRARVSCVVDEDLRATLPRGLVAQVLEGLLRNAFDASDASGSVTVEARRTDGGVQLVVEDEGSGMDEETLARSIEPFFSTKAHGRGMGLGLFLARTLADSLDGALSLESRVGEGTSVTLDLPRCARRT